MVNPDMSQEYVTLSQRNWRSLANSVKEVLADHWHAQAGCWSPSKVRLVVSLRLLPLPVDETAQSAFAPLVEWLTVQCGRIEVTASYKPEHRLYLE